MGSGVRWARVWGLGFRVKAEIKFNQLGRKQGGLLGLFLYPFGGVKWHRK